ncbi:hypothetical protein GCM10009660_33420 [Catellatospora bangladeshensis]
MGYPGRVNDHPPTDAQPGDFHAEPQADVAGFAEIWLVHAVGPIGVPDEHPLGQHRKFAGLVRLPAEQGDLSAVAALPRRTRRAASARPEPTITIRCGLAIFHPPR